jgi:hypothetical protein
MAPKDKNDVTAADDQDTGAKSGGGKSGGKGGKATKAPKKVIATLTMSTLIFTHHVLINK